MNKGEIHIRNDTYDENTLGDLKNNLLSSVKNGIISDAKATDIMEKAEREYYLSMHKYAITNSATGCWMTYLPSDDGSDKRVKKRKKSKEELENLIIDFYKHRTKTIIGELIPEWIDYKIQMGKRRNKFKLQTANRYTLDFHRFFDNTEMFDKDVGTLTEIELEDFILERIDTFDLTAKAYSGLRTILRGALNYYGRSHKLNFSPELFFKSLNLRSYFADPILKKQIFNKEEIDKIKRYIDVHAESVISYGILFGFYTGMRIGEIVALKWEDVFDGSVYVHRTEECYRDEEGYHYQVRDVPKTKAGVRDVILTPQAKEIIKRLREINPDTEYVFTSKDGNRVKADTLSNKLKRICVAVGIEPRAMHKARKTYASTLFQNHVDETLIINQMGHTDIETTKKFYRFNVAESTEAKNTICSAINY